GGGGCESAAATNLSRWRKPAQRPEEWAMSPKQWFNRRGFLRGTLAVGAAAFTTPSVFAEQLIRTPPMTEGPFYPNKLPLDTDNDLIIINDRITPAVGEITHLTGRILGPSGSPVRNAT